MKDDAMGAVCSTHGKDDAYKMLAGKPDRKIPFGTPRDGWYDHIKMDLK
jgi:hypothetical protein